MNNTKQAVTDGGIDPVVFESINIISGAYAALFWESLYSLCESIAVLKNTEFVFSILCESGYHEEAFFLLCSYFEILSLEWPIELDVIDRIPELKEPFMGEF